MGLIDKLVGVLAPYECLGCGQEGDIICAQCINLFPNMPERCYRCRRYSSSSLTCKKCRKVSTLRRVQAVTDYEGLAKALVWRLKFSGAQTVAVHMASLMQQHAAKILANDNFIFVPVPTTNKRARQRGYDQAGLLALELRRLTGAPALNCLARSGKAHQIGANRAVRLKQLEGTFRVKRPRAVAGAHIVLIDDVVTTGTTLEVAAKAMRQAGAKSIEAIVFAQP